MAVSSSSVVRIHFQNFSSLARVNAYLVSLIVKYDGCRWGLYNMYEVGPYVNANAWCCRWVYCLELWAYKGKLFDTLTNKSKGFGIDDLLGQTLHWDVLNGKFSSNSFERMCCLIIASNVLQWWAFNYLASYQTFFGYKKGFILVKKILQLIFVCTKIFIPYISKNNYNMFLQQLEQLLSQNIIWEEAKYIIEQYFSRQHLPRHSYSFAP